MKNKEYKDVLPSVKELEREAKKTREIMRRARVQRAREAETFLGSIKVLMDGGLEDNGWESYGQWFRYLFDTLVLMILIVLFFILIEYFLILGMI